MAASFKKNLPEVCKMEPLNGTNYKRWSQNYYYALKKLEKDNKLAQSYLLNNMSNPLFDLFVNFKSTKIIWTKQEDKYGSDDARKRKYIIGKRLQF